MDNNTNDIATTKHIEKELLLSRLPAIIIKMIIYIIMFVSVIKWDKQLDFDGIFLAFFMANFVYLLCSAYVFILRYFIHNYIGAFIFLIIMVCVFFVNMDKFIPKVKPGSTADVVSFYIFGIMAIVPLLLDIRKLIKSIKLSLSKTY